MRDLVTRPIVGYGIPQEELPANIRSLGYLEAFCPATGKNKTKKLCNDVVFTHFAEFKKVNPDSLLPNLEDCKYRFTTGDFDRLKKQILMMGRGNFKQDRPGRFTWATDQVIDMYRTLGMKARVKELHEIDVNSTACGYGYTKFYENKVDYLTREVSDANGEMASVREYFASPTHFPLWKFSEKFEMLPLEKIEKRDIRAFEIPPVPDALIDMTLFQDFNDKMKNFCNLTPIKSGVVYQRGGFDRFVRSLGKGGLFGTGDVRKYDKSHSGELRMCSKRIREALTAYSEIDLKNVRASYERAVKTMLITPWGQVLEVDGCMKSGDVRTSSDNSLGHLVLFLTYLKENEPNLPNWKFAFEFVVSLALMSDDHIFRFHEKFKRLADYALREKFYASCGFELKKEADVVQDGPIGLIFLGAKITTYDNNYVPLFDAERCMASCCTGEGQYPETIYFQRILALLYLMTFDPVTFVEIQKLASFLVSRLSIKSIMLASIRVDDIVPEELMTAMLLVQKHLVPTHQDGVNFWTGYESAVGIKRELSLSPLLD